MSTKRKNVETQQLHGPSALRSTENGAGAASDEKPARRGAKRPAAHGDSEHGAKAKKARTIVEKHTKEQQNIGQQDADADTERKPRLTTPDLEFDYDRSQLRDPQPTPGRIKRPRMTSFDLPDGWKQQFKIPKPERPPGRLNWLQKDVLLRQEAILDPSNIFHHLHICHMKGPDGSPTYDEAGFQLDWKVDDWMKPKRYNKNAMVKGMELAITRGNSTREQMYSIFFVDGKGPDEAEDYLKDQVSKDLGIPWHQIGVQELRQWEERGFQKKNAAEWWHEPTPEERKRMSKMHMGCYHRKII